MTPRIKDKRAAHRATLAAQAVAAVLAIAGGSVAVFGLPGLKVDLAEPVVGSGDQGESLSTEQPDLPLAMDVVAIAEGLSYLGNVPVPDPEAQPDDIGGGLAEDPPEREVRFVGSIRVGDRHAAFLNVAGVTKLLRPGDDYEGVRLVEVIGDEVVVSINGGDEEMLEKAERHGPSVSLVTGGAPKIDPGDGTAVAGDGPIEPANFTPDMSREERRAALLERARGERARWERERGQGGGPPN